MQECEFALDSSLFTWKLPSGSHITYEYPSYGNLLSIPSSSEDHIGTTIYLWLWLKSFLEGRTQQVRIGEERSFTALCPAGVPKGSVFSPIFFNIYIEDVENKLEANVSTCKYAEGCTM